MLKRESSCWGKSNGTTEMTPRLEGVHHHCFLDTIFIYYREQGSETETPSCIGMSVQVGTWCFVVPVGLVQKNKVQDDRAGRVLGVFKHVALPPSQFFKLLLGVDRRERDFVLLCPFLGQLEFLNSQEEPVNRVMRSGTIGKRNHRLNNPNNNPKTKQ